MASHSRWRRPVTTAEVLDEIEGLEDCADIPNTIYVTPPEDTDNESECDSGDESCNDPYRLSSRQLEAEAQVLFPAVCESEPDEEIEDDPPKKKQKYGSSQWSKDWCPQEDEAQSSSTDEYLPVLTLASDSHPVDYFKLFMCTDLVDYIANETDAYAKHSDVAPISNDELYTFLGILILSGYATLPARRMYWDPDEDVQNPLVVKSMTQDRFEDIFRYLHVADNDTVDKKDRLGKVRPVMEELNRRFMAFAPVQTDVCINELLIPYFGPKHYVRRKLIRFGYKAWVVTLSNGYCMSFDIAQFATRDSGTVAEEVLLRFSNSLKENFPGIQFSLFFDNFPSTPRLISLLGEKSMTATGSVCDGKIENCPLKSEHDMRTKPRGYYSYAFETSKNIYAVRWHGGKIMTIMSNKFGPYPVQKTRRYSSLDKTQIEMDQPFVVSKYDKSMAGADLLNKWLSQCRISVRGNKWYFPILFWMLDVCVVNATVLAHRFGSKLDSLDFRRHVARALLIDHGRSRKASDPQSSLPTASSSNQHLIVTGLLRRRCRVCQNKTTKGCDGCQIPLHDKCFQLYHLNYCK